MLQTKHCRITTHYRHSKIMLQVGCSEKSLYCGNIYSSCYSFYRSHYSIDNLSNSK
ncbi:MAG: hypothetical protein H6R07_370 [Proteobacteria bacterium]|nr:hypothetical protein [Pseudomonadota bacterium]